MAKRKSLFTQTQHNMVSLSLKVPKTAKARADALVDQLKRVDPSLTFNMTRILQQAYEEAITAAEQELAQLQSQGRGKEAAPAAPAARASTR